MIKFLNVFFSSKFRILKRKSIIIGDFFEKKKRKIL